MAEPSANATVPGAVPPAVLKRALRSSAEAGAACREVLALLHVFGFNDRDCFAVHLACEEALANALRHGVRNDPSKHIRLMTQVSADGVRIEIEDDGPGFNPEVVPDPTRPENLERESGRGLLLMRAYMDKVEFLDRGNRVVLTRRR